MSKVLLLSAPYMLMFKERFVPLLESYGFEVIVAEVIERLEEEDLLRYAGQFDAAICGDDRFNASVLRRCAPRLKVISKWGTGIDSIDSKTAAELGIKVCRTLNAFSIPVCDSAFSAMLCFARQTPWSDKLMKSGRWEKLPGRSLSECVLGVIGVGSIGRLMLKRAKAFDMKLIGTDLIQPPQDFLDETGVEMTNLEDLLQRSDFVSLHCDLNETSYHIINEHTLSLMKPTSVLINTARGPLVEEQALVTALKSKVIAGAALDVFEVEPLPKDSELLKIDNVLLSAHNTNSSPVAWEKVHQKTIEYVLEVFNS